MKNTQNYPWRCAACRQRAIKPATIEYRTQVKHENVLHDVVVPDLLVDKCENCGVVLISEQADRRVRDTLREQLQMLRPETIRRNREILELSQVEFADAFGFANTVVCNWENGRIQSETSDRFMRAFFALPALRRFLLADLANAPTLGEEVVVWDSAYVPVEATNWIPPVSLIGRPAVPLCGTILGTQDAKRLTPEKKPEPLAKPEDRPYALAA